MSDLNVAMRVKKKLNACMSGNLTYGNSYFSTQFHYSQKSKDQSVAYRELLGEDWRRSKRGRRVREQREGSSGSPVFWFSH